MPWTIASRTKPNVCNANLKPHVAADSLAVPDLIGEPVLRMTWLCGCGRKRTVAVPDRHSELTGSAG